MYELVCLNLVPTASYKIFTEVYADLNSSKAIHLLPRETFFCFDKGGRIKQSVLTKVNSVLGLSWFLVCYKIEACSGEAPEYLKLNCSLFPCRSASITNLSLDRSGSPMVPAYETSVSPQATRTHMKAETSEDERKILLVPFTLLFALLCEDSEVCLPCIMQQEYFAAF